MSKKFMLSNGRQYTTKSECWHSFVFEARVATFVRHR